MSALRRPLASTPSVSASCKVYASRAAGEKAVTSAIRRSRYRTVFGWTNRIRAEPSIEPPVSKYAAAFDEPRPRGDERLIDRADELPAGVAVAVERPFREQLVARYRAGPIRPGDRGSKPRNGGPGRHPGGKEIADDGPGHDRPGPEITGQRARSLVHVVDPAQDHNEPLALDRNQSIQPARPRRPLDRVDRRGGVARGRDAENDADTSVDAQPSAVARERTASSASPRRAASTTRASSRASQAPRCSAARA